MRGSFVFSLDVELAWGQFDERRLAQVGPQLEQERSVVEWLLEELDAHDIPATWAVVGRLLLSPSDPDPDPGAHAWRFGDRPAPRREDPLWYAPDIVDRILAARVAHEVGTHTFTHVDTADPRCSERVFRHELRLCREVHLRRGLALHSLVYPRNHVAHVDALREEGINVFRGRQRDRAGPLPPAGRRALAFAGRVLATPPPTYRHTAVWRDGVANVPASMFLYPREGSRRAIPAGSRIRQALAGIRRAAERREIVHLWLHPYNLVADPDLRATCKRVFAEVASLANRGVLEPATMSGLATRLQPSSAAVS